MDSEIITHDTKNQGWPFFYVIVPVFKAEKYLNECIQSVLNQSYSNWTLILVDDGSPDNCGNICDSYASKDKRIKVIHKTNGGQLSARCAGVNYVLDKNRTGYVLFLDSDDLFELGAFAIIAKVINKNDFDLLLFDFQTFKDNEKPASTDSFNSSVDLFVDKRLLYKKVFSDEQYNSLWRKCVNLSIVNQEDFSAFYHILFGEDLLQSISYFKNAKKTLFLNACLYRYRMNPVSMTHSINYENYRPDFTVRSIVWDFLKNEMVWNESDFVEYAESCKAWLKRDIRVVSTFKTNSLNKKAIYEKMLSDDYCKIVCFYARSKDIMIRLFSKRHYWLLSLLCGYYKLGSFLKKVIRRIKEC